MLVDQGGQLHTAVNIGFEVDPLGVRFHGLNGNKQDPRNKGISPALILCSMQGDADLLLRFFFLLSVHSLQVQFSAEYSFSS